MTLALEFFLCWSATSILVGTLWSLKQRQRRQAELAFDRWLEAHPGMPIEAMPQEIAVNYFLM